MTTTNNLDIYKAEGAVLSIGQYEFYKIAPNNVENNFQCFANGTFFFDWIEVFENAKKLNKPGSAMDLKISVRGELKASVDFGGDNERLFHSLKNGSLTMDWLELLKPNQKQKMLNFINEQSPKGGFDDGEEIPQRENALLKEKFNILKDSMINVANRSMSAEGNTAIQLDDINKIALAALKELK